LRRRGRRNSKSQGGFIRQPVETKIAPAATQASACAMHLLFRFRAPWFRALQGVSG